MKNVSRVQTMTAQVILELPKELYDRVQRLAHDRQQPIPELIADVLDLVEENGFVDEFSSTALSGDVDDWSEPDEAVEREMQAYLAMAPQLKKQFLGKYVAIHGGKLIDIDDNFEALYERIDAKFPDQFVWLTSVEEEAIPTIVVRSPHFVTE